MSQLINNNLITEDGRERIAFQTNSNINPGQKALLQTSTGEPFMPVRLYFKFLNRKKLVKALDRLRCLNWEDDNKNLFFINYWEPDEIFPITLGTGHIVNSSEFHIDTRSFKRAIEIIKFLYKHVGSQFMYITHICAYNRFRAVTLDNFQDAMNIDFDRLFSEENIQEDCLPSLEGRGISKTKEYSDEAKKQWEEAMTKPIPVIQRIPVKGTKAELLGLEITLMINIHIAQECWEGNTACSPLDVLNQMMSEIFDDLE